MSVAYQPFPELTKSFVSEKMNVGWKDLAWAASNHWLDMKALAELVDEVAGANEDVRAEVADALVLDNYAALTAVLNRQASREAVDDEEVQDRWMQLAVGWLYRHRELFDDPWGVLEEIWEAFGHPDALNGLIRWMPVPLGGKPGPEGMLERWREYAEAPVGKAG